MSHHEISLGTFSPKSNGSDDEPQPHVPFSPTAEPPNTAPTEPPNGGEEAPTTDASRDAARKKWFEDMRGWIMVIAVLVASVTYTTGMNPPGGFWQDDNGHEAGAAILHDKHLQRYTTFFYANATAFMASLVIIVLLMNERFYCDKSKVAMLNISMVLGLLSLMIAFAAGCARRLSTSIYVIVLAVGVLLFVIYSASVVPHICVLLGRFSPSLLDLLGLRGIFGSRRQET